MAVKVRIKGGNLWAENGMQGKIGLVGRILDGEQPGLL